jgi:hypothetical protein
MIEDRLHWVRDLDWDEDRSQVRTASAPQVMAALRNLAITILRLAGYASIATPTSPPRPQAGPAPTDDHELLLLTLPRPWLPGQLAPCTSDFGVVEDDGPPGRPRIQASAPALAHLRTTAHFANSPTATKVRGRRACSAVSWWPARRAAVLHQ